MKTIKKVIIFSINVFALFVPSLLICFFGSIANNEVLQKGFMFLFVASCLFVVITFFGKLPLFPLSAWKQLVSILND